MTIYYVKQGDTAPAAVAVLLDPSGLPLSLSGATVKFHMSDQKHVVIIDAVATVDPDQVTNKGRVSYQWVSGDTDDTGVFLAEWQVTFAGGTILTFPNADYDNVRIDAQLS